MRRICSNCHLIIYAQQTHECHQQQQRQPQENCTKCNGPHSEDQPCYIQPLSVEEEEEEIIEPVLNENQQQQQQAKRQRKQPLRLCFFDAETSQDEPVQISNNINGYRHVPLLIIAEVNFFSQCIIFSKFTFRLSAKNVSWQELVLKILDNVLQDASVENQEVNVG